MTDFPDVSWLPFPDVAERLGVRVSQIRRLIEDRALLAQRVGGAWQVPEAFIEGNEPLGDLRGTIVVLGDAGFTDDEAIHWLLSPEESLGVTPVEALRAGRKAEVRRVAQALGF